MKQSGDPISAVDMNSILRELAAARNIQAGTGLNVERREGGTVVSIGGSSTPISIGEVANVTNAAGLPVDPLVDRDPNDLRYIVTIYSPGQLDTAPMANWAGRRSVNEIAVWPARIGSPAILIQLPGSTNQTGVDQTDPGDYLTRPRLIVFGEVEAFDPCAPVVV